MSHSVSGLGQMNGASSPFTRHGVRSETAHASIVQESAPVLPVCAPASQRLPGHDLPAKGLYVWGSGVSFKEKQKEYDAGYSHYEHKGDMYSLGFMKDWSIDATVGLSVDILDSEVTSLRANDTRKSDLDAFVFNAHYQGTLWEKFLVKGKVFLGRSEAKGLGEIGDAFVDTLTEEKHRSSLMGGEALISVPLIFGDDIKLLPTFGLRYARLRGDSYWTTSTNGPALYIPKRTDKSITLPVSLEVKRDFERFWGTITPRMTVGMTAELEESAIGVRTFNAAAASAVMRDPITLHSVDMIRDASAKTFLNFGIGVDLLTRGGWDLRADYLGTWGDKYTNNAFRLELGRCF